MRGSSLLSRNGYVSPHDWQTLTILTELISVLYFSPLLFHALKYIEMGLAPHVDCGAALPLESCDRMESVDRVRIGALQSLGERSF